MWAIDVFLTGTTTLGQNRTGCYCSEKVLHISEISRTWVLQSDVWWEECYHFTEDSVRVFFNSSTDSAMHVRYYY